VRTDDPPVEDNDDGFAVNVTTGAFGFKLLVEPTVMVVVAELLPNEFEQVSV
jgi:hypothetical protein